jgi:hypothetical protein
MKPEDSKQFNFVIMELKRKVLCCNYFGNIEGDIDL